MIFLHFFIGIIFSRKGVTMSNERNYKSNVFVMLLEEKDRALELYNAVNDSDYDDPEQIVINTIEGGFELSVQNDASFIFDNVLSIYEHQSTYCPNMPLRSLIYFTTLVKKNYMDRDIFSRRLVKIPCPKFVVFYNGVETQPDYQEMRLSDCFIKSDEDNEKDMLELVCRVYNINEGHNKELLDKCKWLSDYMVFIDKVREYHRNHDDEELHQDIEKAIDYCIKNNILKDFLKERRTEVLDMTAVDYTYERRMILNYNEGKEDGIKEGIKDGIARGERKLLLDKISKKLSKGKSISQIADELEESEDTIKELAKEIE